MTNNSDSECEKALKEWFDNYEKDFGENRNYIGDGHEWTKEVEAAYRAAYELQQQKINDLEKENEALKIDNNNYIRLIEEWRKRANLNPLQRLCSISEEPIPEENKDSLINNLTDENIKFRSQLTQANQTIARMEEMVDRLLAHCDKEGGECCQCSTIVCPHKDPMHFHHDGCPSCSALQVASNQGRNKFMENKTPHNEPAFPSEDTYHPNGQVEYGSQGMTLRDYLAAKAMQGLAAVGDTWFKEIDTPHMAKLSYSVADAMLKAREMNVGGEGISTPSPVATPEQSELKDSK